MSMLEMNTFILCIESQDPKGSTNPRVDTETLKFACLK